VTGALFGFLEKDLTGQHRMYFFTTSVAESSQSIVGLTFPLKKSGHGGDDLCELPSGLPWAMSPSAVSSGPNCLGRMEPPGRRLWALVTLSTAEQDRTKKKKEKEKEKEKEKGDVREILTCS
jgi:hypothetical protein